MTSRLSSVSKAESKLKTSILSLNDGSELDFTKEYLKGLDVDRLKHILLFAKTMRIKKAS